MIPVRENSEVVIIYPAQWIYHIQTSGGIFRSTSDEPFGSEGPFQAMVPTRPRCPVMVRNFRHWPEILRRLVGGGKQGTCWELVVEIRGIGCWCFLSRFLGDFGRRVCRIVALGGSNQLHQLQEIRRKTAWSDPFIVIYRNLWGNPWTQLQCATTSDYCPRSAPGERGERGEANDLYDLNILKLGLFIVIGHRQFKYTLFHLLIWLS